MEGRPWLRILLVLIGFSLLGGPVWIVTHAADAAAPARAPGTAPPEPLRITVTFSAPPATFDLDYLGAPLWSGRPAGGEVSVDWKVAIPKEGVDLFVAGSWPTGAAATAVRVRVSRGGNSLADQTFWPDGSLAETVTVRDLQP